MSNLFGTDGIRGRANEGKLSPGTIMTVGMAAGIVAGCGNGAPKVIIGKDTRESGYMVESALVAGLTSVGADPVLLGPLPTPGTSWMTRSMRADMGIMITASHNPYHDNGMKFFGPQGCKVSDDAQNEIARLVEKGSDALLSSAMMKMGRTTRIETAQARYIEATKQTVPRGLRLSGLKIVLDCANGAAYRCAPEVLWELGAELITIGNTPNGRNINENCGATSTSTLRAAVITHGADIGLALDGDGDRLIVCDEFGKEIEGDQVLSLIAERKRLDETLLGNRVAATVMSNLALEEHLADQGISVIRTPVGDRMLAQEMHRQHISLGGEPSGHIILSDYACTGDGLVAALQVLSELKNRDLPASQLLDRFRPLPQFSTSVRLTKATASIEESRLTELKETVEARLPKPGRAIVRKSGTEPLIRITVEALDRQTCRSEAAFLADALMEAL